MTTLRAFLSALSQAEREAFAVACATTWEHLRNCMYGTRQPSAALAAQIELESKGEVPRHVTRPKDAHLVWPADFRIDENNTIVRRNSDGNASHGVTGIPVPVDGAAVQSRDVRAA